MNNFSSAWAGPLFDFGPRFQCATDKPCSRNQGLRFKDWLVICQEVQEKASAVPQLTKEPLRLHRFGVVCHLLPQLGRDVLVPGRKERSGPSSSVQMTQSTKTVLLKAPERQ